MKKIRKISKFHLSKFLHFICLLKNKKINKIIIYNLLNLDIN